ncbi:MAG: fused MFS/spermidine synthase [Anaeromyxobacteraceae bacterium]
MLDVRSGTRLPRWLLLVAFALSGAAALTYEVVWTRSLSVVLGSTTYALSTMLATFMLGLAIGGIAGGRVADRRGGSLLPLGLAELGIGLLGVASHLVIEALPSVYFAAYRAFHLSAPAYFATQVGLCAVVMLGPTVLMGMTFPLVVRAAIRGVEEIGRGVGLAYGVNTIGAVAGSLLAGFVLIPALGLRGATFAAAGANAVAAAIVLVPQRRGRAALLLLLLFAPVVAWTLRVERGWKVLNFYNASKYREGRPYAQLYRELRSDLTMLSERDGAGGYVAAFRDKGGSLLLQVGGKIEGTGYLDRANAELLAYLPLAAHSDARRMLVIGLGAGVTLDVARRFVPDVELAEINLDVLEAVRRYGPPGLLDGRRVHLADARNLLQRSSERWDVISSEPSYPTDFAVANLFSREFYQLAAARLADGGVYCQWLPYYILTNDDVTMMVKTFASVFRHATLWKVEGSMDLLLVGSTTPAARSPVEVKARVARMSDGVWLDYVLSRDEAQVAAIAGLPDVPVNTDDRPRLEYAVARNLRVGNMAALEHGLVR